MCETIMDSNFTFYCIAKTAAKTKLTTTNVFLQIVVPKKGNGLSVILQS